jgi:hypothetical protein
MDDAIQNAKDAEEEARMRKGLADYGYDEKMLEGINLPGLRALFHEKAGLANPAANDARMALDGRGRSLAERLGVTKPRRL